MYKIKYSNLEKWIIRDALEVISIQNLKFRERFGDMVTESILA